MARLRAPFGVCLSFGLRFGLGFGLALGLGLPLAGCAGQSNTQSPDDRKARDLPNPAITDGRVEVGPDLILNPVDYLTLIEASPRTYTIDFSTAPVVTHFGPLAGDEGPLADSMWIQLRQGGETVLATQDVPEPAQAATQAAHVAYGAGDFNAALAGYKEALAAAPRHPKLTLFYANTLYSLERYAAAQPVFEEALALNPIDYQGHFFIADNYYELGEVQRALAAIILAHIYNPNHVAIRERMDFIAAELGMAVDPGRLSFAYQVLPDSDGGALVLLGGEQAELMALSTCEAAWLAEPQLRELLDGDELGVRRITACMASMSMLVDAKVEQGEPVDAKARWLRDAILANQLEPIIYWEYVGHRVPEAIARFPPELIASIAQYVSTWVLRPVPGANPAGSDNVPGGVPGGIPGGIPGGVPGGVPGGSSKGADGLP